MSRRRGSVMLAVMVVMAIALLVILGMMAVVRGEVVAAGNAPRTTQSRALAWSGLQAIGSTLDRQRDRILDGRPPTLRRQLTIVEDGGRIGVVRLLPFGPDGQTLVAEAGKVDLNAIDAEGLASMGLVDGELAERIIAHRDALSGGRFQSELDLLAVPGLDAEILYGSVDRLVLDPREGIGRGPSRESRDVSVRGLLDAVTVHGVEPALQRSGVRRINLNRPWSSELGERVEARFGAGAATGLRQMMESGMTFDREGRIAETLAQFEVPPADWADILDAFTTEPGDLHGGRVDLNRASTEALLSLPGLTPPEAAQIVREREALTSDELAQPTWPMVRGILSPERFGPIAHRVTTRSWTWRVRFAAGEVDAEDPDGPLLNPVVWEAVVDLSGPAWRVAYLRECTLLPLAAAWMPDQASASIDDDAERAMALDDIAIDAPPETEPAPESANTRPDTLRAPATPRATASDDAEETVGDDRAPPARGPGVGRHRM